MSKEDVLETTGKIEEILPGSMFRVRLDTTDHVLICYLSGRLKKHKIKIVTGDSVKLEMSPYDLNKGRISYRL